MIDQSVIRRVSGELLLSANLPTSDPKLWPVSGDEIGDRWYSVYQTGMQVVPLCAGTGNPEHTIRETAIYT